METDYKKVRLLIIAGFLFLFMFLFGFENPLFLLFFIIIIVSVFRKNKTRQKPKQSSDIHLEPAKSIDDISPSSPIIQQTQSITKSSSCPVCGSTKVYNIDGKIQCGNCGYKEL